MSRQPELSLLYAFQRISDGAIKVGRSRSLSSRADTRLYREIAEAFGVCLNSVYNIKAGRTYAVLPGEDAA